MESTDETGTVPQTDSPVRDAAQNEFPASQASAGLTGPGATSASVAPPAIGTAITPPTGEPGTALPASEASIAPPASDADGRPPPGAPPPPAAAPAAAPAVAPDLPGFTLPAPTTPGEVFFAVRNGLPLNMRDSPPGLKRMFFEASKCIYAALCADAGDNSGVLHDGRWRYSIALALGSNKRPEEMGVDIYGRVQAQSESATATLQTAGDAASIQTPRDDSLGSTAANTAAAASAWAVPQPLGSSNGGAQVSAPPPESDAEFPHGANIGNNAAGSFVTEAGAPRIPPVADQAGSGSRTAETWDPLVAADKRQFATSEGNSATAAEANRKIAIVPGTDLKARRAYVIKGGGAIFPIESNPSADSRKPLFEIGAVNTVNDYSKYIEAAGWKWGVDPDLIRAVMYMEQTHGYYDAAFQKFDLNRTILPMNVHDTLWGDFVGTRKQLLDPQFNINAGAKILANIQANLVPNERNVSKIATLYNKLGATKVTDYGARVAAIYAAKPWIKK